MAGIAVIIILVILWIGVGMKFIDKSMDASLDCDRANFWKFSAAAILWFVLPIAYAINDSIQGAENRPLCLQGHEAYIEVTRHVMVGKIMTRQTRTERQWICDARAENR